MDLSPFSREVVYPDQTRTVLYGYGTAGAMEDIMSRLATIDDDTTGPDDAGGIGG